MTTNKFSAAKERTAAKIAEYEIAKAEERSAWDAYMVAPVPGIGCSQTEWNSFMEIRRAWIESEKKTNRIGGSVKRMVNHMANLKYGREAHKYHTAELAIIEFKYL